MNSRVLKFIDLAEYLYRNNWVHFRLSGKDWTEDLEGEEKIFGIVIRTLLCNDDSSEKFFKDIGGLRGVDKKYKKGDDVVGWLKEKLEPYKMGTGRGSHRDSWRHKKKTPQGIVDYLKLTNFKQKEYFNNIKRYNELFNRLKSASSVGCLTAFDLTKRLYEAGLIDLLPDRFYLTGTGEVKGVKALFPGESKKELIAKGTDLVQRIIDRTGMPEARHLQGRVDLGRCEGPVRDAAETALSVFG